MIIENIYYSKRFKKEFGNLPRIIAELVNKKEQQFKKNPLHPSLRLHGLKGKLKGFWSISITRNCRIIFKRKDNGDILFFSVGKHDIYRSSK